MLHRSLKVGASPEYWLIMPLLAACGTGIVKVIGLWNFLRLGSTVTIGDTATLFPSNLATRSAGIGCAYTTMIIILILNAINIIVKQINTLIENISKYICIL